MSLECLHRAPNSEQLYHIFAISPMSAREMLHYLTFGFAVLH